MIRMSELRARLEDPARVWFKNLDGGQIIDALDIRQIDLLRSLVNTWQEIDRSEVVSLLRQRHETVPGNSELVTGIGAGDPAQH